mgnify:CR=1 FL=1
MLLTVCLIGTGGVFVRSNTWSLKPLNTTQQPANTVFCPSNHTTLHTSTIDVFTMVNIDVVDKLYPNIYISSRRQFRVSVSVSVRVYPAVRRAILKDT